MPPPNLDRMPPHIRARFEPQPDTPQQIIACLTAAIQRRLDEAAQSRGYDSILSAVTYIDSSVPQFAADAREFIDCRDDTWATATQIMGEAMAGKRPVPTEAELMALLPAVPEEPKVKKGKS
jgi:hypothetical protein